MHKAASENAGGSVITLLLDRGADIESRNQNGFTPLHYAALSGAVESASALVSNGADVSARTDLPGTACDMGPWLYEVRQMLLSQDLC